MHANGTHWARFFSKNCRNEMMRECRDLGIEPSAIRRSILLRNMIGRLCHIVFQSHPGNIIFSLRSKEAANEAVKNSIASYRKKTKETGGDFFRINVDRIGAYDLRRDPIGSLHKVSMFSNFSEIDDTYSYAELPVPNEWVLLMGMAAHEVRHRMQFVLGVDLVAVDGAAYKGFTDGMLSHSVWLEALNTKLALERIYCDTVGYHPRVRDWYASDVEFDARAVESYMMHALHRYPNLDNEALRSIMFLHPFR
ncbi:TPA: hypothetical protein DDZ49_04295 [Candidatus Wolfebacteria bacterium]|uniref:Uncharacterized protein n=2 Tax=Candidatus Wolfeibacteriota TaxID=1752735 RepID=A0A0G1WJ08_9BACT|nr:MAG: hypothetical protein UX70_C0001G0525 [Candidatus Wolfebacteria bacterium GW2011_GWB1_47_1]KKU42726.1 MAG: hypothetical protein UX58_C0001G0158 [Candidatus Wolfebacteria bacterium GW2011_GWB2_46_69]KKU59688.1 MAG: hypothetical protein UX83_C0003G0103 [Candidatus Wolfebacteria bacterium GW2011_GWE2_47_12]KKU66332.1 MAG: hypothetical protein UX90_C0001G0391 [Candidatus Wolfebacteria bacterium GW2011_GWD2_47_17]KKU74308.1 MAG: hypothetical protein UY00_C0068G0003 [Candidatus Wolfebacteria b